VLARRDVDHHETERGLLLLDVRGDVDRRRRAVDPGPPAGKAQLADADAGGGRAVVHQAQPDAQGGGLPAEHAHVTGEGVEQPPDPLRLRVELLVDVAPPGIAQGVGGDEHLARQELPVGRGADAHQVLVLVREHGFSVHGAVRLRLEDELPVAEVVEQGRRPHRRHQSGGRQLSSIRETSLQPPHRPGERP
jgi:hypothetical protein